MVGKLLVGISGSIGVVNMPSYLLVLRGAFPEIQVIMTWTAQKFIPKETMVCFTKQIHSDPFAPESGHMQLAKWADLMVVIPATAHTLAQAASGLAGSLLTTVILAHEKPVLFFPNMNRAMWEHPATQRNAARLQEDGHQIFFGNSNKGYELMSETVTFEANLPMPDEFLEIVESSMQKRYVSSL
jgi:phosphopantothenoylcysteine synthetase/decarboxylase